MNQLHLAIFVSIASFSAGASGFILPSVSPLASVAALGFLSGTELARAENPCDKDRETLCKDVKRGGGRLAKCMRENSAKLSPECKASIEKRRDELKDVESICKADIEKLCPGVKKKKEILKCMRKNKDQVSAPCKEKWDDFKEHKK